MVVCSGHPVHRRHSGLLLVLIPGICIWRLDLRGPASSIRCGVVLTGFQAFGSSGMLVDYAQMVAALLSYGVISAVARKLISRRDKPFAG